MATKKTPVKSAAAKTKRPVGRPRKAAAQSPVAKAPVAKAPVAKTPVTKTRVAKASVAKAPAAQAKLTAKIIEAPRAKAAAPKAAAPEIAAPKAAAPKVEPKLAAVAGFGAFANLGKENLNAVIESGNILAKGIEGLNQQLMAFAGATVHYNIEATSALFGAKTVSDMVNMQRDYAQQSLDRALSESAKLTQLSAGVARDAFAPLQSRVAVSIETVTRGKAA